MSLPPTTDTASHSIFDLKSPRYGLRGDAPPFCRLTVCYERDLASAACEHTQNDATVVLSRA